MQGGEAPLRADRIEAEAADRYREIFHGLLERGICLAPSAYEVGFLSLAHTEAHLDEFAAKLAETLAELG